MPKRLAIYVVALAAATAAADIHPDSSSWTPLFATDLSNAEFKAGVWTWTNGMLTASEDSCLWTRAEMETFVLDLEFCLGEAANSGVVLYCSNPGNWIPNSLEVQLLDDAAPKWKDAPPTWRCGGIFGRLAPSESRVRKAGEWNRMTIWARGPEIAVALNGGRVARMDLRQWTEVGRNPDGSEIPPWLSRPAADLPTRGRIGLQGRHDGADIFFRNVRWRALRPDEPLP